MPKLYFHLDALNVMEAVKRHWRDNRYTNSSSPPTPFDEPTFKALIEGLVTELNGAMERVIVSVDDNTDALAHMSVFHPVDGWVPLCKAGMYVSGTCIKCVRMANKDSTDG